MTTATTTMLYSDLPFGQKLTNIFNTLAPVMVRANEERCRAAFNEYLATDDGARFCDSKSYNPQETADELALRGVAFVKGFMASFSTVSK